MICEASTVSTESLHLLFERENLTKPLVSLLIFEFSLLNVFFLGVLRKLSKLFKKGGGGIMVVEKRCNKGGCVVYCHLFYLEVLGLLNLVLDYLQNCLDT